MVSQSHLRTKLFFIGILFFAIWNVACVSGTNPSTPPIFIPFEAQKSGMSLTTELRIKEHRVYIFALMVKSKDVNNMEAGRKLLKLLGRYSRDKEGKLVWPGISIPVKLKVFEIKSSGEKVLYDKEIFEEAMMSGGPRGFAKLIDSIPLKAGHYRVTIRSLENTPELFGYPISLGIYQWPNAEPLS